MPEPPPRALAAIRTAFAETLVQAVEQDVEHYGGDYRRGRGTEGPSKPRHKGNGRGKLVMGSIGKATPDK
jgi:hypothetical protein